MFRALHHLAIALLDWLTPPGAGLGLSVPENHIGPQQQAAEPPPVPRDPNFAEAARRRLAERGVWRPEWERAGLLDVFAALGDTPQSGALLDFLARTAPPVAIGRLEPRTAHELHGIETPESAALHRQAADLMQAHPGITYRQALEKAVGGRQSAVGGE